MSKLFNVFLITFRLNCEGCCYVKPKGYVFLSENEPDAKTVGKKEGIHSII